MDRAEGRARSLRREVLRRAHAGRGRSDPDGAEAARAWWISPTDLLAAWESEEVRLYWPTHYTMVALAGRRDADDLLRLRLATREPDDDDLDRLPRSVFFQDR